MGFLRVFISALIALGFSANLMADAVEIIPDITQERILELANELNFKKTSPFAEGVYAKYNGSSVFIASIEQIQNYDQLYGVMVRVLSEKYGCMIRKKVRQQQRYHFFCRDSRVVIMRAKMNYATIHFTGKQYTKDGLELIVENHKIVKRRAFEAHH